MKNLVKSVVGTILSFCVAISIITSMLYILGYTQISLEVNTLESAALICLLIMFVNLINKYLSIASNYIYVVLWSKEK